MFGGFKFAISVFSLLPHSLVFNWKALIYLSKVKNIYMSMCIWVSYYHFIFKRCRWQNNRGCAVINSCANFSPINIDTSGLFILMARLTVIIQVDPCTGYVLLRSLHKH